MFVRSVTYLLFSLLLAACGSKPQQPQSPFSVANIYYPAAQTSSRATTASKPLPTQAEPPQQSVPTYGERYFDDGSYYKGQLLNGVCEGQGILSQASGHVFNGLFIHNKAVEGTYHLANGETQTGRFVDFKLHGEGVKILADGTHIRAHFEYGEIAGEAIITPREINKQDAFQVWKNQQLVYAAPGPTAITKLQNETGGCNMLDTEENDDYWVHALGKCYRGLANGLSYVVSNNSHELIEGEFKNGRLLHGIKFTYQPYHGGYIEATIGTFNHFTINGPGQRYRDRKLVYVGEFVADEYHGLGSAYDADGRIVYQGEFAYGKRHGQGTCLFQGEQEHCVYHQGERVDETHIMRNTHQQKPGLPVAGSVIEHVVQPITAPQQLYKLTAFNTRLPWAGITPIPYQKDSVTLFEKVGSQISRMEKPGKSCSSAIFLTENDPEGGLVMVELVHRIQAQHDKTACVGGYLDKKLHSYLYRCENGKWQYLKRIVDKDNADMMDCYLNGYVTHYTNNQAKGVKSKF